MSQPYSKALHFAFHQIPEEGFEIHFEESFRSLLAGSLGEDSKGLLELETTFSNPITGSARVLKVASKVDVRGEFQTKISGFCDRCMIAVEENLSQSWQFFLMPKSQFSKHDKPGGKVIHGPSRSPKASRHRSSSKSKILTDAQGEHEDVSFGAFDGKVVDLRPLLREELILSLPMRFLCSSACRGLCLACGQNLNLGLCEPGCPSIGIEIFEAPKTPEALENVLDFRKT